MDEHLYSFEELDSCRQIHWVSVQWVVVGYKWIRFVGSLPEPSSAAVAAVAVDEVVVVWAGVTGSQVLLTDS